MAEQDELVTVRSVRDVLQLHLEDNYNRDLGPCCSCGWCELTGSLGRHAAWVKHILATLPATTTGGIAEAAERAARAEAVELRSKGITRPVMPNSKARALWLELREPELQAFMARFYVTLHREMLAAPASLREEKT